METLWGAQKALAAFDRAHWKHEGGAATIRHTYAHLRLSLMELLSEQELGGTKELWQLQLTEYGPALFVEHAIRLANTLGEDLTDLLRRQADVAGLDEWFHRCTPRWRRGGTWPEWFVDFFTRLKPLERIIERIDHGKPADSIFVQVAIAQLMEAAVQCAPPEWTLQNLIEAFEWRLETLTDRFAYARA